MDWEKLPLEKLFDKLDKRQAEVARKIYQDYKENIETIPGSSTKHQIWEGGYLSHIEEAMNIASVLYDSLSNCRPLPFSLSDALFCVYMHDFDKVQRFRWVDGELLKSGDYSKDYIDKTAKLLKEKYDYELTSEQYNALKYAHGEGLDYHPTDRIMLPLATLVHCADVISARVWYNDGKEHDSWSD